MLKATKTESEQAKSILASFAHHGFQKTRMQDIAHAIGISRQSVYKRFGSKERCYHWSIQTYLANMYKQIFSTLNRHDLSARQRLALAFDILIGGGVETIDNSHGAEVFYDILKATHASEEDWPLRFRARLADFLQENHLARPDNALGMAFALISAGKGLLLETASRAQFMNDINIIITSLVGSRERTP